MKHCTYLQRTSKSVFLKAIAQSQTISWLFPDYELTWEHPVETDHLLLLNVSVVPIQFTNKEQYDWIFDIPVVEAMPGTAYYWDKALGLAVKEVEL
jgi:hypothetical protein